MVLDLNNYPIDAIPVGLRISDGWMQAVAVRSGGFSIVPLAAAAPAVKVLFVVMMYISVCKCSHISSISSCSLLYRSYRYEVGSELRGNDTDISDHLSFLILVCVQQTFTKNNHSGYLLHMNMMELPTEPLSMI